jgi:excinuclease UvrABC nuclease subunit
LYENPAGEVIYVGKVKDLSGQVSSYFHEGRWMHAKTGSLDERASPCARG